MKSRSIHIGSDLLDVVLTILLRSIYKILERRLPSPKEIWNRFPSERKLLASLVLMGFGIVLPMAVTSTLYLWRVAYFSHSFFAILFLVSALSMGACAWAYPKLVRRYNVRPKPRYPIPWRKRFMLD